jgi:uncharacterized protein YndB with AHSA1/START domain
VSKKTIIERTFKATLEEVWELWTTKDGIEAWWGPEGFTVKVHELDLRPGGVMRYSMIATAPEMVEFMKKSGMPTATECRLQFTEVAPGRRLACDCWVDFVPGVKPYPTAQLLELSPTPDGVKMVLTLDPMHDDEWTKRAAMGWESELGKLDKVLQSRREHATSKEGARP